MRILFIVSTIKRVMVFIVSGGDRTTSPIGKESGKPHVASRVCAHVVILLDVPRVAPTTRDYVLFAIGKDSLSSARTRRRDVL